VKENEMPTLTITLPKSLQAFVDEQVASGSHADAGAFITSVLKAERKRRIEAWLVGLVQEAEASGPASPMTKADWDRLKERVWEREAQRKRGAVGNGRKGRQTKRGRQRSG
jgi:Arc/MetJ-type ribon-helix-helix transcriptional regulator